MLKKLAIYLLIFATTFNVTGGYGVAALFNSAAFSVCQLNTQHEADPITTVKKASSDVVIVTMPVIKEADEDEGQKFAFDFDFAITSIPYFLPLLRAGPCVTTFKDFSFAIAKKTPLFLLNCNFRI
jgi:hypothetical protein